MNAMTAVDIILLAAGVFFLVRGIIKGLSGEVFSLVGTVGGFVCSIRFYDPFAEILIERFEASLLAATIISMLGIFFAIFFGCSLLDIVVKKIILKTNLTVTDKVLGGVVGFIKLYFLTLIVLIAGAITAPMTGDSWMKNSRVLSATSVTLPFVSPLLEQSGLMPDLAALQEQARDYIYRHAESVMIDAGSSLLQGTNPEETPASRDEADSSNDVTP